MRKTVARATGRDTLARRRRGNGSRWDGQESIELHRGAGAAMACSASTRIASGLVRSLAQPDSAAYAIACTTRNRRLCSARRHQPRRRPGATIGPRLDDAPRSDSACAEDGRTRSIRFRGRDPSSPRFNQFLTLPELEADYCPSDASVSSVEAWAKAAGQHEVDRAPANLAVSFDVDVATAQRVFQVQLSEYAHGGHRFYSHDRDPTLPAEVAWLVDDVLGLESYRHMPGKEDVVDEPRRSRSLRGAPRFE